MADQVRVTPRAHRASWCREASPFDCIEAPPAATTPARREARPVVLNVVAAIDADVERLLVSIAAADYLWRRTTLSAAERELLVDAAELIARTLGRPEKMIGGR